ncbi:hypothetical protein CFC21_039280 [Triticum aestivum]|uniref:Uncharacterized protein n=3 Tax=Triticum TaxID=4564 RepID=A0A9R1Q613_TRITD|nr:hypothetical protein CFC21_039280 [Triticum aestivum]VAH71515.1 unnamed protein product [Triticum turgidum subsp. durum]
MSSCPFADLVVVALLLAVVAVVLLRALACAPRSMHQGLHGWNKSSSMLRDGFGSAASTTPTSSSTTPTASSSSSTSAAPFAHPSPSSVLEATKPADESLSPEPTPVPVMVSTTAETAQLPDDPEFYQDLLRGLQLPDIDPMDFRAGLDALDVSEASAYLDGEQDLLLGDFADEELDLDMDLDIGDDFLEMPGCDFGRGMDDFLHTVDFCV